MPATGSEPSETPEVRWRDAYWGYIFIGTRPIPMGRARSVLEEPLSRMPTVLVIPPTLVFPDPLRPCLPRCSCHPRHDSLPQAYPKPTPTLPLPHSRPVWCIQAGARA